MAFIFYAETRISFKEDFALQGIPKFLCRNLYLHCILHVVTIYGGELGYQHLWSKLRMEPRTFEIRVQYSTRLLWPNSDFQNFSLRNKELLIKG